jgi:hypothetical protein
MKLPQFPLFFVLSCARGVRGGVLVVRECESVCAGGTFKLIAQSDVASIRDIVTVIDIHN